MEEYVLINGKSVPVKDLSTQDLLFLLYLAVRVIRNDDYFVLLRLVRGPGAYPLRGSVFITKEIHSSPFFRIAHDLVDRVGMRQGLFIPLQDMVDPTENLLTVATVAQKLGVTRVAVNQMLRSGRLQGKRYGRTWVVERAELERFRASWKGPKRGPKGKGKKKDEE